MQEMNKRICIYPGSFDPPTKGHMDIIERAASIFDVVVVLMSINTNKTCQFSASERMDMLEKCCMDLPNVRVEYFEGLSTTYARVSSIGCMVRGLRTMADFESEQALAQINARIDPDVETVFLMCKPEHRMISSSAVREMAYFGCDFSEYVPLCIVKDIMKHYIPKLPHKRK